MLEPAHIPWVPATRRSTQIEKAFIWKGVALQTTICLNLAKAGGKGKIFFIKQIVPFSSYFKILFFASSRIILNLCKIGFMPTGPGEDLGYEKRNSKEANQELIIGPPINFFSKIYTRGPNNLQTLKSLPTLVADLSSAGEDFVSFLDEQNRLKSK